MTSWDGVQVDLLPPVLQEFVRLIGLPATLRLVEAHGGVRLYIPANPNPHHHLAALIGLANLEALAHVFGLQEHFYIPKATRALLVLRDAQIRAEHATKPASQLAREYRLNERHIWRILSQGLASNDGHQGGLF